MPMLQSVFCTTAAFRQRQAYQPNPSAMSGALTMVPQRCPAMAGEDDGGLQVEAVAAISC